MAVVKLAAFALLIVGVSCLDQTKYCWDLPSVTISLSKLNGTWYVQKYSAPKDEILTKCETQTYTIDAKGNTGKINNTFTYTKFPQQLTAFASLKEGEKPGSFLYQIDNFPFETVSYSSILALNDDGFVSCYCAANGAGPNLFVVATKKRDTSSDQIKALVKLGLEKGLVKNNLIDVQQTDC